MFKAVIIGASSGVGRALANELASKGFDLVLIARSERDITCLSANVRLKYEGQCYPIPFDIASTLSDTEKLFSECLNLLGHIDAVMVPAGYIDSNDSPVLNWEVLNKIVAINYTGVVRTMSPFIKYFEEKAEGQIIVFSSIAAVVPRKRNTIYSSAKIALEAYFRGLRHHLSSKGVKVKIYALGYVDTSMSFGQKLLFPACSPEKVASHIATNFNKDFGKIYYPRFWGVITAMLRILPWSLYKRLNF